MNSRRISCLNFFLLSIFVHSFPLPLKTFSYFLILHSQFLILGKFSGVTFLYMLVFNIFIWHASLLFFFSPFSYNISQNHVFMVKVICTEYCLLICLSLGGVSFSIDFLLVSVILALDSASKVPFGKIWPGDHPSTWLLFFDSSSTRAGSPVLAQVDNATWTSW